MMTYAEKKALGDSNFAKLPEMCVAIDRVTGKHILLKRGETGFWQLKADFNAAAFNEQHGVTAAQVLAMECGSLFGVEVPGANPDSYTDAEAILANRAAALAG